MTSPDYEERINAFRVYHHQVDFYGYTPEEAYRYTLRHLPDLSDDTISALWNFLGLDCPTYPSE